MKVKSESEVTQSYQTLSDPMDCSPPGSSIHGIFQARVLEWGAIAFSNSILLYVNLLQSDYQTTGVIPLTSNCIQPPGISLEGMMLKLKLQYFGPLMKTVDSLEKTLMLGGTGGRRRRGQQRMKPGRERT